MAKSAGEKTKETFIVAAGQLLAEKGLDRVSLSEIAKKAGIDASMINYHFGGKDGLIEAVVNDAMETWLDGDIRKYYQQNHSLLDTRDGQIIFITGLVESVFTTLGTDPARDAGKRLLLQLMQQPHPFREELINRHIKPNVGIFLEIYQKITGNDDFESAFCWYLLMICPKYMASAFPGMIDLFHPQGKVSTTFDRRLQHFTTIIMLHGLGLQ